ncbi:MAG: class I SAM-dependent methyltransferase [Pseudomonadota bacterium]
MSTDKIDWEQLYRDKFTPWDCKRPDSHLVEAVTNMPIKPCRALELGCGTGTNAIWLAEQGFTVIATDISETALAIAKKKKGIGKCTLLLTDFLEDPLPGTDFEFVFDLGCFHGFDKPENRDLFARRVSQCLASGGCWLNISSSADGEAFCPRRISASDISMAVEPYFEIVSLAATYLDDLSKEDKEALGIASGIVPRAWSCFMRKRSCEE